MGPELTNSDNQDSVESILHIAWQFPLWLVIVLAIGSAAMVVWLYHSERGPATRGARYLLTGIRFSLLMLVLWMITGWSWLRFQSQQPELVVVLDRSASMSTRDASSSETIRGETTASGEANSRWKTAVDLIDSLSQRRRERLQQAYQMRWFAVADTLEALPTAPDSDWGSLTDVAPDGTSSRLGDALVRVIQRQAGKGTAGIIFISDGINTTGSELSEAAKAARRAAIPILTVALGKQTDLPDLRLADLLIDRNVYLGDQVTAEVSVIASDVPNVQTRVVLRDQSTGKILDATQISLSQNERQATARLSFVPERPGEIALRIEADAIPGEQQLENNFVDETVSVQDKLIRVLLVSDSPNYEYRFLKSFLERATQHDATTTASFELLSVLQDADPLFVEQDKSALRLVPTQPEQINQIDVFVLIDFDPQLLSQISQQAIVDAVMQRGAGCIFVAGHGSIARRLEAWPLAKLLPVESSSLATAAVPAHARPESLFWQPTALGRNALPMQLASSLAQSPAVWQRLPHFSSVSRVEKIKEGAQVLAQATDRQVAVDSPLLITQFAGAGRSALQATDETYRWTSFQGSDLYHQRYWGQMLRWLCRGKLSSDTAPVELLVEPKQTAVGQPIRFQVRLGGEQVAEARQQEVELAVEGTAGRDRTFRLMQVAQSPRDYQSIVSDLPPGSYRARVVRPIVDLPPTQEFTITAPPGEQAVLRSNVDGLRELSEQSRGRAYTQADAARLFDDLPAGKPTRLGALPPQPIWNAWWVAALFITLITTEWIVRRRAHML